MGDRTTEIRELAPDLFMIRTGFPQVYLFRDGPEVTMIDAGFPGGEPALAAHGVLLLCPGHGEPAVDPRVLRRLGAALASPGSGSLPRLAQALPPATGWAQ